MAIALLGLLAMQIVYLEKMVDMRNSQFSEIVKRSLYSVSTMLEQNETKYFLDMDLAEAEQTYKGISQNSFSFTDRHEATIDTTLNTEDPANLRPANRNTLKDLNDSYQRKQEILRGQFLYQKSLLYEVILTILNHSSDRPIQERADSVTVDSYLRSELEFNGLTLPFEFAIVNRANGVVYKTSGYSPMSQQDVYSLMLFPNDPKSKQNTLNVMFPTKSDYIFSSVKFLVPSLAFTFLLLGVFLYTITVAFRQKKLSEIKNDFINNMTHEFKTPISSISIAAQMLNDDSVRKSPEMLKHVSGVINDETKRSTSRASSTTRPSDCVSRSRRCCNYHCSTARTPPCVLRKRTPTPASTVSSTRSSSRSKNTAGKLMPTSMLRTPSSTWTACTSPTSSSTCWTMPSSTAARTFRPNLWSPRSTPTRTTSKSRFRTTASA